MQRSATTLGAQADRLCSVAIASACTYTLTFTYTARRLVISPRYFTRKMRYCSGGMRENTHGKEPHLLE